VNFDESATAGFLTRVHFKNVAEQTGAVDLMAFDKMVEKAAFAPRRFGLAPLTSDLFPTEAVSTTQS
jgi:hypothetical protein